MRKQYLKSNFLLLLTAIIWGFAFVAQRVGVQHIGTFTFNGIRFLLGALSLIPLILYRKKKSNTSHIIISKSSLIPGIIIGIFLFLGSSFQQLGLIGTTSGKAAFITGLYIVLVPLLSIFLHHHIGIKSWIGAILAVVGLYALCLTNSISISRFDFLELICAFCFALHIMIVEHYSNKIDALELSLIQYLTCSIFSIILALFLETINLYSIISCSIPILYGGIFSVGIAYTLQIIGQKNVPSSNAAIILSLESVFATIGGFLLLGEHLGLREIVGCLLIFSGMIVSQLDSN